MSKRRPFCPCGAPRGYWKKLCDRCRKLRMARYWRNDKRRRLNIPRERWKLENL